MNTYNIKITATKVSPFSGLDIYDVLNGGNFVDPFASPLSFYYPITSYGNIFDSANIVYSNKYFSVSSQELFLQDLFFQNDGTHLYAIGSLTDDVYEYELTTPWDISTASYNGNFFTNNEDSSPRALFFKNDGYRMYILGNDKKRVFQYSMSNWDITTASYSNSYFVVSSQEPNPRGLHFKSDGSKMYVIGLSGRIYQYDMSNPWDVSSASYTSKYFSVSTEELSAQGLFFRNDGSEVNIIGVEKDTLYNYKLTIPWDISTATYNSNYYSLSAQDYEMVGIYFDDSGLRLYSAANNRDRIYQYNLIDAWQVYTPNPNNYFYNLTAYGGNFKICYNDLRNIKFDLIGKLLYCSTKVVFDFSEFDQTKSKIVKLIFDPDNNRKLQTYDGMVSGDNMLYPVLSNIYSEYHPSEKFYTLFFPKFKVEYEDGTMLSLVYPLTVTQCGIFDTYKERSLIESLPYYKNLTNVILFTNDKRNNQLYVHDINTRLPFVLSANLPDDIQLPDVVIPVPMGGGFIPLEQPIVPEPPTNINPVTPPLPYYIYAEDLGIFIVPNNSVFFETEEFNTNNSLIILNGGAPFFGGTGITINVLSV
jgi:hypothetical protein